MELVYKCSDCGKILTWEKNTTWVKGTEFNDDNEEVPVSYRTLWCDVCNQDRVEVHSE